MTKRQLSVLLNQTRALQRRLRRVTPSGAARLTIAIDELVELRRLAGRRKPKKRKAKRKAAPKRKTRPRARAPKRAARLTERAIVLAAVRAAPASSGSGRRLLSDVRRELEGRLSRNVQDRELLALQDADVVTLYRNDNTASLTPDDERAALFVGGHPRHLVFLHK